jgi:putative SOS response-associated peptidase YedK
MCGRFTLYTTELQLREIFALENPALPGLKPRYNIAPSQPVPIIRIGNAGREMVMARWGLTPHWSKEAKTRYSTINARIETVADKPAYRTPFKHRRCLIPADGFYEWAIISGRKMPHYIRRKGGGPFAMAGLWDRWEGNGESLESCSIIVMPSCGVMKPLHERMPAILAPTEYDLWTDPSVTDKAEILNCLDPAYSSQLEIQPISPWVNSPKHDDKRCLEPVAPSPREDYSQ